MCGIAGYVDFNTGAPNAAVLTGMTQALGRRGPDSAGTATYGPCGFAHTRLSIIDVEGSPQPMRADDRRMAIVYNGETYNYQALRDELRALGETFETAGDTEAVLRWVAREWTSALPRIDGMFAFGVWDLQGERLLLARDAFGEKPLYYASPAPGVLVFGSEQKALLRHPGVDPELNEDALRQALRFRAVYGREALHRGIRQLEPGAWLEFSRRGLVHGRHHDLAAAVADARDRAAGQSDAQLREAGRALFEQSVKERLIADVPVGAFLSGGLDSSLIVAAVRAARPPSAELRTFSVGFEGDPHSELPFAQTVADQLGATHQPISVGADAYVARLAELSACRDGPVSQPADVAIAEMSRVARQSVKVVLSGEGADEVFAGYPKHGFAAAPWALRAAARLAPPALAAGLAGAIGLDPRRARVALTALSGRSELDRLVQWFSYLDQDALVRLLPGLDWRGDAWAATVSAQTDALAQFRNDRSPLVRMQAVDCLTWLPGNMLERGDRMTMAEGLEVRPPFLDKELAAFGLALPDRMKVHGGVGKWVVRRWADEMIPAEIIKRKKWGFRAPLNLWFRGPLREMLHDHLLDDGGLIGRYGDKAQVSALLAEHDSGQHDRGDALWTLLSVAVWYRSVYQHRLGRDALALAS